MFTVETLKNDFFNSNTYIIKNKNIPDQLMMIDPGDMVEEYFKKKSKETIFNQIFILLTHEHYDHICGIEQIPHFYSYQLFCSEACYQGIIDPKINLSYFIEKKVLSIKAKPVLLSDGILRLMGLEFLFLSTPGHSPGSACYFLKDNVFTGDTILNKVKTHLKFPHSSRQQYKNSLRKIKEVINPGVTIYPGHGNPFVFNGLFDIKQ